MDYKITRRWCRCIKTCRNVKSYLLSNRCTIKYSKKNVKIYIKINIKMLLHVSVQNDHHQGAWRLCFAKVIIIKIANWNMSLKTVRLYGCLSCWYFFLFAGSAKKLKESNKTLTTTASWNWRHFRKGPRVTEDAARKFWSIGTGVT